jgi:transposase-like protein DUF772
MQADLSTLQSQDHRLTLPLDLGAWIDKAILREWIEEEIGTLNWSNPELVAYLAANPAYKPRRMLGMLTYAYATGLFGSEEIVRNCYEDEHLRSFCQQESPTAISIKRFRRENRGLLKWCLQQLFKRAFRNRFGLEDRFIPAGLQRYLDHAASTRLNIARQMDRTEEP